MTSGINEVNTIGNAVCCSPALVTANPGVLCSSGHWMVIYNFAQTQTIKFLGKLCFIIFIRISFIITGKLYLTQTYKDTTFVTMFCCFKYKMDYTTSETKTKKICWAMFQSDLSQVWDHNSLLHSYTLLKHMIP